MALRLRPRFLRSGSHPTVNRISTGLLLGRDDTIALTPTLTWIKGRHTLKFGAELHRNDLNYFQNNSPGGSYTFDNLFTSQNALNRASRATGSLRSCSAFRQTAALYRLPHSPILSCITRDISLPIPSRPVISLRSRWVSDGRYLASITSAITVRQPSIPWKQILFDRDSGERTPRCSARSTSSRLPIIPKQD